MLRTLPSYLKRRFFMSALAVVSLIICYFIH